MSALKAHIPHADLKDKTSKGWRFIDPEDVDLPFDEASILFQLFDYWQSKMKHSCLPARKDIDPCEIYKILPQIYILDIENTPDITYRFSLFGTGLVDSFGGDPTSYTIDEVSEVLNLGDYGQVLKKDYGLIYKYKKPLYREYNLSAFDRSHVNYRSILCPLSNDGLHIEKIIACVSFGR